MLLFVDIETCCSEKLTTLDSEYLYSKHQSLELLTIQYAIDDDPVALINLAQQEGLDKLDNFLKLLNDSKVQKIAHNASFDRVVLKEFYRLRGVGNWVCTKALARYYNFMTTSEGYSLDAIAKKLGVVQKLDKTEMLGFSSGELRPETHPNDWVRFLAYARQDVEVLREVHKKLRTYSTEEFREIRIYQMNESINDRGVPVASKRFKEVEEELECCCHDAKAELSRRFGVNLLEEQEQVVNLLGEVEESKSSKAKTSGQIKQDFIKALELKFNIEFPKAKNGDRLFSKTLYSSPQYSAHFNDELKELLNLAFGTSKSKLKAFYKFTEPDSRIRGCFVYCGASSSHRFAGRKIQPQNMPRIGSPAGVMRSLISAREIEASSLTFADFSSIEPRIIGWYTGEPGYYDPFVVEGIDLYCEAYKRMYGVEITKATHPAERQLGKTSVMAFCYGSGARRFKDVVASVAGVQMSEEEAQEVTNKFREGFPVWKRSIEKLGYCYKRFKKTRQDVICPLRVPVTFSESHLKGVFKIKTPFNSLYINDDEELHGGKILGLLCQSTGREFLCELLFICHKPEHPVVAHVHDEVIFETSADFNYKVLERELENSSAIRYMKPTLIKISGHDSVDYDKE